LLVIEAANPAAAQHLAAALDACRAEGWVVRESWLPVPGRVVCSGSVRSEGDARALLLAALGGAGVVAVVDVDREVADRLVDDLRRLGPVRHVTDDVPAPIRLDPQQRALLALLAEGLTLGEAAWQLGLSRRTADRRLALGTDRTAEAIARAKRLGWLGSRPRGERP
jgi:DNA-binding NarL/FixJ family response regulator